MPQGKAQRNRSDHFLGLAGYYRDFIPNFAAIAVPLSDLTWKGQPNKVEWGQAQEKAYQTINSYLTSEHILRLPDPAKNYFLRTDASSSGNRYSINAETR